MVGTEEYKLLKKYLDGRTLTWWVNNYFENKMKYQTVAAQLLGNINQIDPILKTAINDYVEQQKKIIGEQ